MTTSAIELIVAVANYNAIGYKNNLVWTNKRDLAQFKALTLGHPIIMGRKTWESLPKRPLPGRRNIIVSNTMDRMSVPEDVTVVESLRQAIDLFADHEKVFVIGGARLYSEAEKICSKIHMTRVFKSFIADTYVEPLDYTKYSVAIGESFVDEDGVHATFYTYTKV